MSNTIAKTSIRATAFEPYPLPPASLVEGDPRATVHWARKSGEGEAPYVRRLVHLEGEVERRGLGRPNAGVVTAAVGRDAGETEAEANSLVNLSEDRLASGAPAEASTTFARVRALADADAWLRWRYLLRLQASHARERLAHDAVDEATEAASALLAQAESQGAGKYVIVAHELMARSALARGDRASARRALDAARRQRARTPVPILDWKLDAFEAEAFDDAARRAEAARSIEAIVGALSDEDRRTFLARADVRSVLGSDAGTR